MYVFKHRRWIVLWISMCAALVASMVLVGGYTRLSGSGLSITQWKPIHGVMPPRNDAEWQEEFAHYKASPQYEKINKGMTLDEFKTIFWPEYWHRVIGRVIGIAFLLPLAFFYFTRSITGRFAARMLGLFALGGAQGFMGWYMVSSGLINNPYVSHVRLAMHLALAFTLFALLLWALMDVMIGNRQEALGIKNTPASGLLPLASFKLWFVILCLQILYGALMAGLHAGLLYNTYPTMNGMWLPPELLAQQPLWLNLFENHTTVQFIHRTLAVILSLGFVSWWFFNRLAIRNNRLGRLCAAILLVIAVQFALGVLTLIHAVPLALALKHQINALLLFGLSMVLWYRMVK